MICLELSFYQNIKLKCNLKPVVFQAMTAADSFYRALGIKGKMNIDWNPCGMFNIKHAEICLMNEPVGG